MKSTKEIFELFGSKLTSYDNEKLNYRICEEYTHDSNDIFVTYPVGSPVIPTEHIFCNFDALYERIKEIIKEGNTIYIDVDILEQIQAQLIDELFNDFKNEFKKVNQ